MVSRMWVMCLVAVAGLAANAQQASQKGGEEAYGPRKANTPEAAKGQMGQARKGWNLSNWRQGADGRRSAPTSGRRESIQREKIPWPDLTPEQNLIRINGLDTLTYGAMMRHARLAASDITIPADMTVQEYQAEYDALVYKMMMKFTQTYITKALFAQEARKKGIELKKEEIDARREEILLEVRSKRKNPAESIKEFETPGSFFQSDLVNSLLYEKLRRDVIRPAILVTDADLREAFKKDEAKSQEIADKNAKKLKTLEETLVKIKDGADFAELAGEVSECDSAEEGGVFGSVKREDLLPELADVLWSMDEGQVHGKLVETPYSWHILKLNKKNRFGLTETEKESPIISVNFSHIVMEKVPSSKPLTPDMARERILDEREIEEVNLLIETLLLDAKIDTPLPLFPK